MKGKITFYFRHHHKGVCMDANTLMKCIQPVRFVKAVQIERSGLRKPRDPPENGDFYRIFRLFLTDKLQKHPGKLKGDSVGVRVRMKV
jgi:hypothetical protein